MERTAPGALRSAEVGAAARALGAAEREAGVRNPDRFARAFLGPVYRALTSSLLLPIARRIVAKRGPGLYWFAAARSRHIDAVLTEALSRGLDQLVIVGAGFDTRAWRFARELAATRVFEVDLPAVVAAKLERLSRVAAVSAPVTRVALDLEREDLADALRRAGFLPERPTLVIAEAVLMFLNPETSRGILRLVAGLGGRAAIVFDGFDDSDSANPDLPVVRGQAERMGAPIRFTCPAARAAELVGADGLRARSVLTAREAVARYLTTTGRPLSPVTSLLWLCHAERP